VTQTAAAVCTTASAEMEGSRACRAYRTWRHAVMNGVPLMVVARNLGHAGTKMVEKHYGHLAPSYAEEIRKKAPRFGFKPDLNLARLRG
jgi:predicted TIM-barrel fold metal-dependent hydrolase